MPDKAMVVEGAIREVMNGDNQIEDVMGQVNRLPMADRMEVIIILRRAGFLTGPARDITKSDDR